MHLVWSVLALAAGGLAFDALWKVGAFVGVCAGFDQPAGGLSASA